MRPGKAEVEGKKLFSLESVKSQHALLQSLAAPLTAKERKEEPNSLLLLRRINSGASLRQDCFLGSARDHRSSSPYQHPLAAFVIVLDILIHPVALGTVQLMTPFV